MSSPTSTGPAGAHFEGKVGAHHLLSLLVGAQPRGLRGMTIDRVELQRASQGMYLDDVIIRAHDRAGNAAVLEIQVKRTVTFAPKDEVFRSVVEQIAQSCSKPGFWVANHQMAIATSAGSRKIDGAYQDVLTRARQIGDAKTSMEQLRRSGSANPDMRTFVDTFRSHLRDFGVADDDETVWKMLRRLQILVFDFTAQGSLTEELERERCARALKPEEASRAGELWSVLTDQAIEIAASAGDRDRKGLLDDLQKFSFGLAALPGNDSALRSLAELSRDSLADIDDSVCGVKLSRLSPLSALRSALDSSRYVELRGDAGVGKSGILKHLAEQIAVESEVLVLTPDRTPTGGWFELKSKLRFNGECRELQQAAPRIAWLLSDSHPARNVTRNLYRLARLSSLSPNESVPLSEAEMAIRWWEVADGKKDDGYIDRARLLRSLALQVIRRADHLDTSASPASAITALIQSETLRMLGIDRVAFRHDVLREWAAASLLFTEPATADQLPLHDVPPTDLALCCRASVPG